MILWRVWTDYQHGYTKGVLELSRPDGVPLSHMTFNTVDEIQNLIDGLEDVKRDLKRKALSPFSGLGLERFVKGPE